MNINLHNRHPKDLPDKETIEDILLELEDTRKFEIKWVDLKSDPVSTFYDSGWRANNRTFHEWVEKGEVVTCEMDSTFPTFNISEDWSDQIPMSYATVKQTRYDILRHPIRVSVKFKAGILSLNKDAKEIIETSNDVYLRLKDYLGPDVIQDQFDIMDFDIDFMLTSCRIK